MHIYKITNLINKKIYIGLSTSSSNNRWKSHLWSAKNNAIQAIDRAIYKYGKEVYPENLRIWFISLYQILFGSENGPRLGSLFYLYKKEKVLKILEEAI